MLVLARIFELIGTSVLWLTYLHIPNFQTSEDGTRIAEDLMKKLGLDSKDLIPGAYMDLIETKETAL